MEDETRCVLSLPERFCLGMRLHDITGLVQAANRFHCEVKFHSGFGEINGKSLIEVSSLARCQGPLWLETLGDDALECRASLWNFLMESPSVELMAGLARSVGIV